MALWQPYATLYAHGIKTIETRGDYSSHRGLTGIHATLDNAQFKRMCEDLFYQEPFFTPLKELGYTKFDQLPRGGIIGAANIIAWKKMVVRNPIHTMVEMNFPKSTKERAYGNYVHGRYGIFSKEVFTFKRLFPAKGKQNLLFEIDVPKELIETAKVTQINYDI